MGIQEDAIQYINRHKKELIEKYAGSDYPSSLTPVSIFMAGSPGAGKTEFSKSLLRLDIFVKDAAVRIDADEIKNFIPHYTTTNSDEVQGASVLGLIRLHDYCLKNKKNFILDGTFSDYQHSKENITRSIKHNRTVAIFYIYLDPVIAWEYTKKRGELEGRYIPKQMFINAFFEAKENVNRIKKELGKNVHLCLISKDTANNLDKLELNVDVIDHHLKINYTREDLEKLIF